MRNRWAVACLLAAAIALPFFPACSGQKEDAPQASNDASGLCTAEAEVAQLDLKLRDMNGAEVNLADFRGKPLLLNFWATWCPPCLEEIPYFNELATKYKDEGLVILGISTDDTAAQLKPFAAEKHMNYPVLVGLDEPAVERAFGPMWAIPVTIFVKKDGTVCKTHKGTQSKEFFEQHVKALL
ncbi:MAG: TlpA family protein disulfide reductase [Acidobacteriota bacterium]|nr:TlpA family protein disulfide reductase [Acidobacteriota bacterium]